jgi:hypothetical protein
MSNVIDFRSASARRVSAVPTEPAEPRRRGRRPRRHGGPSMHTFLFRSLSYRRKLVTAGIGKAAYRGGA